MAFQSVYNITMLGEFTISFRGKKIYDQSNRSKKPWNLLEYLVTNRDRTIPQNELINLLWDEDESENPTGALKVLLHRVRKSLEPITSDVSEDLVVLKGGAYSWNSNNPTTVDTDKFVSLCEQANDTSKTVEERIKLYTAAFAIYKGDFLPRNAESWVVPIASYYHAIFMRSVFTVIELYNDRQDYQEIISICRKAVKIEKSNEDLYYNLIYALYKSGQQEEALSEYSKATDLFYKSFGITPSDKLKSLYKTIMESTRSLETDINTIKEALSEKGEATGAFKCEYEFFKDIYQLEARACARSGDSIYLCLITVNSTTDSVAPIKTMNKAIQDLDVAIGETLRKGDIYARYSVSQFVILLPTTTYENVEMIMKRISSSFYRKYMKKDVGIQYKLQPLDPKM